MQSSATDVLTSSNAAEVVVGDLLECAKFFHAFAAAGTFSLVAFPNIRIVAFYLQRKNVNTYASGIFEREGLFDLGGAF